MGVELQNKKVLQMGLGILGGGVATAIWLLEQGAVLTITDLKDEDYLKSSLAKLSEFKDQIKYVLGEHRAEDFLANDIIVINPDVPALNKFVKLARDAGKIIENELTLFYKFCPSSKIVAVTGTRGKTTTVNWIGHLVRSRYPDVLVVGNAPDKPLLQEIKKCKSDTVVVIEAPSFLLEICDQSKFAPHIAVITNLYQDHINRHKNMEGYALAKANIFKHQSSSDFLILNKENAWTDFFLTQKPQAQVLFCSEKQADSNDVELIKHWGAHNLQNFQVASKVALNFGITSDEIKKQITSLPQIKFRQEKIFDNGELQIFNDTTATSPEALSASIQRFLGSPAPVVFICGGTDRELDFGEWSKIAQKLLKPTNLILLSGSATEKMKKELGWPNYNEFDTLTECLDKALEIVKNKKMSKIVFSPGAKSFEKFKNEFDRGEKFNMIVAEVFR